MLGEDKNDKSPRSFSQKRVRSRLAIIVAGVIMNFVLAGILLSIGYMVGMSPIRLNPDKFAGKKTSEVVIASVLDGTPAAAAGLKTGDVITGFSSSENFSTYTKDNLGKKITLDINRDGKVQPIPIDISTNKDAPVGVGIVDIPTIKLSFFKAIAAGFTDMVLTIGYIAALIGKFVASPFRSELAKNVAGPIGIFNITGQAVKMGLIYIIQLAAILSLNLGLINILPIPALDGGRAVIIFAEGIFRKKLIKSEVENLLHTIGFILIILLLLAVTYKEIAALF
jgi:regulator of sigma E protease